MTEEIDRNFRASSAVASAEDEARRLRPGTPVASPSPEQLVVRVGARFTTVARTIGSRTVASRIFTHAPVLLAASQAEAANANGGAAARVIRAAARQVAERAQIETLGSGCPIIGTTGIARAVITFGSSGRSTATPEQVHSATDALGVAWIERKKNGASHQWVEPMMIGSAMLGAILERLGATEINAEAEPPRPPAAHMD